jgi:nucleotide-binding universal stress UspA family protein
MLSVRTILYPTDFSACSEDAFRFATSLARDNQARLVILHVATPPPLVTPGELQKILEPATGYRHELKELLGKVYAADPGITAEHRLTDGDPATEILSVAKDLPCDLIVMGTHGRTGLGRLLLGSVAEQVLRAAPCPVVTVRASPTAPGDAATPKQAAGGK